MLTRFQDRALEHARGGECGDETGDVKAQHHHAPQAERAVQEHDVAGMKAAMSSMYTGSRAEQVMNGVTRWSRCGRACSRWCGWP